MSTVASTAWDAEAVASSTGNTAASPWGLCSGCTVVAGPPAKCLSSTRAEGATECSTGLAFDGQESITK